MCVFLVFWRVFVALVRLSVVFVGFVVCVHVFCGLNVVLVVWCGFLRADFTGVFVSCSALQRVIRKVPFQSKAFRTHTYIPTRYPPLTHTSAPHNPHTHNQHHTQPQHHTQHNTQHNPHHTTKPTHTTTTHPPPNTHPPPTPNHKYRYIF